VSAQTLAAEFGHLFRVNAQLGRQIGKPGFQLVNIVQHLLLRFIGGLLMGV